MLDVRRKRSSDVISLAVLILGWLMMPTRAAAAQFGAATRPSLSLLVLSPNGNAAVGAQAVLVPWGHSVEVTDGRTFDDDPAYLHATVDGTGRLNIPNHPNRFLLVIVDTTGFTQSNQDELKGKARIALTAWGSVAGKRFVGDKPGVGLKVIAWGVLGGSNASSDYDPHVPAVEFIGNATVDSQGRYEIDRLPAGEVNVAPNDPSSWGESMERPLRVVHVHSAASATLDIGGRGRPVVGRVALPPELLNRHDWTYWFCTAFIKMDPEASPMPKELEREPLSKQIAWWSAFNQTPEAKQREAAKELGYQRAWAGNYPFDIQVDGTFRIEDVEPGTYEIAFDVVTKKVGSIPRVELAKGKSEFTMGSITGARSNAALELPPIPAEMVQGVHPGDMAPDFTVMGLDDQPLQLSKFRGRYVLLEFWATWCGGCVAEMDNVKAVYDKYGKDAHLAMLSLSADESPDRTARFAAVHGLSWRQGFLGSRWDSPIEKLYGVESIPSIWLIGPDGKVIRKNLHADELMAVVGQALPK